MDVAEVEGVVEAAHHVPAHLGDPQHLRQLLRVASDEIEEGEALKVLGLLVGHLDDLVVALPQCLHAQLRPVCESESKNESERDCESESEGESESVSERE